MWNCEDGQLKTQTRRDQPKLNPRGLSCHQRIDSDPEGGRKIFKRNESQREKFILIAEGLPVLQNRAILTYTQCLQENKTKQQNKKQQT